MLIPILTDLDGETATVHALSAADHGHLARMLLDAAGPGNARVVRTVTGPDGRAFQVPTVVAYAAGLVPAEADQTPAPETDPAAVRKTPAKKPPAKKAAAAKTEDTTTSGTPAGGESDGE